MKRFLTAAVLLSPCMTTAEPLDDAEVRIPYAELRRLLEAKDPQNHPEIPPPSLASARFKISRSRDGILLDATFRTLRFAKHLESVELIGGNISLESIDPAETTLMVRDGMICHASAQAGSSTFTVRFQSSGPDLKLILPSSPSIRFETSESGFLIDDASLEPEKTFPLPAAGGTFHLRALSPREVEQSSGDPVPSDWTWQFQTLLREDEGELDHLSVGRASATVGSGQSAEIVIPPGVREIHTTGEDLVSSRMIRDRDGATRLLVEWKSRDVLERELIISYHRPLKPLDDSWKLVPIQGAENGPSQTRFIIATNPRRSFSAKELSGPFDPGNLPVHLREKLAESPYLTLESAGETIELGARELPLVATADAVVTDANWKLRQENDGARIVDGILNIEHRKPLRIQFDVPAEYELLTCIVNDENAQPIDRGEGKLEVPLPPPAGGSCKLELSFTAKSNLLDPVAGTLALALPSTPLFIRSLIWQVNLPANYRAEVHGNLTREDLLSTDPKSAIRLRKNLCRDEVPRVTVFYQRSDLNTDR